MRDMVLFTGENNDIANQSLDTSFFTSEKNRMTYQLASVVRRSFLSRCFLARKSRYVYNKRLYYIRIWLLYLSYEIRTCKMLLHVYAKLINFNNLIINQIPCTTSK